jgi:hypothetical protein
VVHDIERNGLTRIIHDTGRQRSMARTRTIDLTVAVEPFIWKLREMGVRITKIYETNGLSHPAIYKLFAHGYDET